MALQLADFNLSEERMEFRDTLRRFFEEHSPVAEVRRVMESGEGISESLWKLASEELGLAGIAISEECGGQGFGLRELAIALGESGRSLAPIPLFASAALAGRVVHAVVGEGPGARWLEPIAAGRVSTLAWVESNGGWDPASAKMEAVSDGNAYRLRGQKHFVLAAPQAEHFFIVARVPETSGHEGLGLFAVDAGAEGLEIDGRETFDITGIADGLEPGCKVDVSATAEDGRTTEFKANVRLDSDVDVEYYMNGGILQTVLRKMARGEM